MNWLNIFPLIKDPEFLKMSTQEELISLWIPSSKIAAISFGKNPKNGFYVIEILFNDSAKKFEEEFESLEEAKGVWMSLQMSLGIKVPKKRGPKPKYFEKIEESDESINANAI